MRQYLFKSYNIKILQKTFKIGLYHYSDDQFYFCSFLIDQTKFMYDLFESYGFYVDKADGLKFITTGKLLEKDVKDMWIQIESQYAHPIESTFVNIDL